MFGIGHDDKPDSMAELVITAAAEADYLEAYAWYAERSSRAANGFEREFELAQQEIAGDPQRFASCDARHRRYLLRRYPYQVVYREEQGKVIVIAVAHAKRKPRYWHER